MHNTPTRVAILASSDETQQLLSDLLEEVGLVVVARELPSDDFLSHVEAVAPDVLLVDFSEESDNEIDIIDTLLGYDKLPILFNDSSPASGGANTVWAKKLARKLSELIATHKPDLSSVSLVQPKLELSLDDASSTEQAPAPEEALSTVSVEEGLSNHSTAAPITENTPTKSVTQTVQKPEGAAVNFWVLGASLGGPQAVRQFLAAVKADLPVAFILAQHIGGNHISLLAEQLDRVTPFKVLTGRSGYLLRHHEVVLAPADTTISITDDGYLSLGPAPENVIYSPSVDGAMSAVAKHYGNMAGTIVFSGMGDDGARGCEEIAKNGGVVWAQDVDSCVISSMPDQARKTHTVTYSANPRTLADQLYRYYSDA